MAVSPSFRGKGIAKQIMAQAEALAKESGMRWVKVDTNKDNIPMNSLFKSLDYTLSGEVNLLSKPLDMFFTCWCKSII
jgi:ribosomal protein S18 acetylase RimI-like enzyme